MSRLSREDMKLIAAKVRRNLTVEYNEGDTLSYITQGWEEAKSDRLFHMFGDELILKKQISVEKSVQEIANTIRDKEIGFIYDVRNALRRKRDEGKLDFLSYSGAMDLMVFLNLATNRVPVDTMVSGLTEKPLKFSKGQKLTKAIAKLTSALELPMEDFEDFRIYHSQILNDKILSGTLCLSIHPLDYMTMSDNANGWDSCLSWDDNGCYQAGSLDCIACQGTIVAYLESDTKKYQIDNYHEWNSKKWRQLVTVGTEAIMTNKGYPFRSDDLSNIVLNWVAELAGERFVGDNIDYEQYSSLQIEGFQYINVFTNHMYDDTDNGSHSFVRLAKGHSDRPAIHIGGYGRCLCCGGELDTEEQLVCYNCNDKGRCDECEDTCDIEDLIYVGDYAYCRHCYSYMYATCECCGEDYTRGEEGVYLNEDEVKKYEDEVCSGNYCFDCINDMVVKEEESAV